MYIVWELKIVKCFGINNLGIGAVWLIEIEPQSRFEMLQFTVAVNSGIYCIMDIQCLSQPYTQPTKVIWKQLRYYHTAKIGTMHS